MAALDLSDLTQALSRFVSKRFGSQALATNVRSMDGGHAGLTFGFDVHSTEGAELASLIIRLAPVGVKRRGNTDVYRQAPLLKALFDGGLPVPRVPFSSPGEDEFGTPYIVMEKLSGQIFFVWDPDGSFDLSADSVRPLWIKCVESMADFHQFDWRRNLADWEEPRPLQEELLRWDKILTKTTDPDVAAMARRVRDLLLEKMPADGRIGLVHGDFQPGNTLYDRGEVTGIIDWELSFIGHQGFDLGWLMMLADPENWTAEWKPVAPPSPDELREAYELRAGAPIEALGWFTAFAGYKLGVITGINVHLHRSGHRPDPIWEYYAKASPKMFKRAEAILKQR